MVSDYSDAGQERWLADNGIDLLRGSGRLAGTGVVEVGGVRHTAENVVVACGADPFIPPVPGLRELDGIWTNREATGMKAVPRRLLVLGGGPVGVEMAQAVRRLGGEVVLVEGSAHLLAREPAPLGEALGDVLRRDGIELVLGAHATAARRDGEDYVLELDNGRERARRPAARGHRPAPPDRRHRPGDGRHRARARTGSRSTPGCAPASACGRSATSPASGRSPTSASTRGEVVAANLRGEPREANYDAVPRVTYTDPQAAAVGATEAPLQRDRARARGRQDRHLHPRVRRVQRLPDPAQRRRAADRRLRARPGGRRVAAAGHARHPRPRAARGAERHDPALPDLLGDLRPGAQGAARGGQGAGA